MCCNNFIDRNKKKLDEIIPCFTILFMISNFSGAFIFVNNHLYNYSNIISISLFSIGLFNIYLLKYFTHKIAIFLNNKNNSKIIYIITFIYWFFCLGCSLELLDLYYNCDETTSCKTLSSNYINIPFIIISIIGIIISVILMCTHHY